MIMEWKLKFISESDFTEHVKSTIEKYGEKLESFDVKRFNKNIIDPIKLIFDKTVYRSTWEEIVSNEIFRQRDKSNNNDIGYFHQRIFQYIMNCRVPDNGKEGGWDVIYENEEGIKLPDGDIVHHIYVEMKNKHNTMNSASCSRSRKPRRAFTRVCLAAARRMSTAFGTARRRMCSSATMSTPCRSRSTRRPCSARQRCCAARTTTRRFAPTGA